MLLDTTEFAFCAALERIYPTLRRDAESLAPHEFKPWPVPAAFTGTGRWLVYPFFLRDKPAEMIDDFADNCARCPESVRALRAIPHIESAAFSCLEPGCHILPHIDRYFPGVVRAHLGLVVPEGAKARIGTLVATWQEGKVLLFDGQIEHEVANLAPVPRTILLADFVLTPREQVVLERARGTG